MTAAAFVEMSPNTGAVKEDFNSFVDDDEERLRADSLLDDRFREVGVRRGFGEEFCDLRLNVEPRDSDADLDDFIIFFLYFSDDYFFR